MPLTILVAICCATLFFRAAYHERLSPWPWSLASVGLTGVSVLRASGMTFLLALQAGLFIVMWWYNARRQQQKRSPH